ncbi:MAG: hypothetical protein ACE5EK_05570 [Nitrospinales bacterium]
MNDSTHSLKEEVHRLYYEPEIGSSYKNTYGEENIRNLVEKCRSLNGTDMQTMLEILGAYVKSTDLTTSYVSLGVLHALGMDKEVEDAYEWALKLDEKDLFISHFDIGKSLADYFFLKK